MGKWPLEKNLVIFLDPARRYPEDSWLFSEAREAGRGAAWTSGNMVAGYPRKRTLSFLLDAFKSLLAAGKTRRFYLIDDGLMTAVVDAATPSAYRRFARNHVKKPVTLRQRARAMLPLFLRAECRFIAYFNSRPAADGTIADSPDLEQASLMFFSNPGGKLMLTAALAGYSHSFFVYRTTANEAYLPVMEREYSMQLHIAEVLGKPSYLPEIGRRFTLGGRVFFPEEFLRGARSAHEVIHGFAARGDQDQMIGFLDRAADTYQRHHAGFAAEKKRLAVLYRHLFTVFRELHPAGGEEINPLIDAAEAFLDGCGAQAIPVIAHNDLWPSNIMVLPDKLVFLDWERARPERAPFFDYYYLIVAAVLEYLVAGRGGQDYAAAFERFIKIEDAVCRYAHRRLRAILWANDLDERSHCLFLLLFLTEWSVQGYLALGRQTPTDQVAHRALVGYCRQCDRELRLALQLFPGADKKELAGAA